MKNHYQGTYVMPLKISKITSRLKSAKTKIKTLMTSNDSRSPEIVKV